MFILHLVEKLNKHGDTQSCGSHARFFPSSEKDINEELKCLQKISPSTATLFKQSPLFFLFLK